VSVQPVNYNHLTQPERAQLRGRYVEAQGGNCHHCGAALSSGPTAEIEAKPINWKRFPPNFLRHPVHLHHNHKTGKTIGAVHARCNAVLWQYHGE
jgi:hypothetical protein